MADTIETWTGEGWQQHVAAILGVRYGYENVQRIPAKHQGDWGLDSIVRLSAETVVYQCYAPEEPLTSDRRYEKQRDKLTQEVNKFIANRTDLTRVFGVRRVRRWILAVPLLEAKQLIPHATGKAAEIRAKRLAYVADDFEILLQDQRDFAPEREALILSGQRRLNLPCVGVAGDDIVAWQGSHNELVENLRRKLRKVHTDVSESTFDARVNRFVELFVDIEARLRNLKDKYPDIWEVVVGAIDRRERELSFIGTDPTQPAHANLRAELERLRNELERTVQPISLGSIEDVVHGTLAGWLLRCPLDFA